jgi:hypothetical protein
MLSGQRRYGASVGCTATRSEARATVIALLSLPHVRVDRSITPKSACRPSDTSRSRNAADSLRACVRGFGDSGRGHDSVLEFTREKAAVIALWSLVQPRSLTLVEPVPNFGSALTLRGEGQGVWMTGMAIGRRLSNRGNPQWTPDGHAPGRLCRAVQQAKP